MSMPVGKVFNHGYGASSTNGMGYREIAERMTEMGDQMNHSTARNILMRALEKIAEPLIGVFEKEIGSDSTVVARDPRFQDSMVSLLHDIYD